LLIPVKELIRASNVEGCDTTMPKEDMTLATKKPTIKKGDAAASPF
jgi:hypothetical protein